MNTPTTVYAQGRKAANAPITDRMGNELNVGDLIVYALFHFQVTGSALYVGHITKISPRSRDVYATNIPLVANEKSEEKKIKDLYQIMKIEKNFIDQLMLKRLTLVVES